jgi:serine protease AprX
VNAAIAKGYAARPANRGLLGVPSTGLGLIQLSRDTAALVYVAPSGDGLFSLLIGEVDALGNAWLAGTWGNTWDTNPWAPFVFEATGWDGKTWSGKTWSGTSWQGQDWGGKTWS